ncbi:MAG: 4'-phosphopantetheinyl transferase superfamily protein [Acidobacteriota bacterium]
MTDVHIHFASVPGAPFDTVFESLREHLDTAEIDRTFRFVFERDRLWFATAHAFLRRTLASYAGCHPLELAFETAEQGRPELVDRSVRFNLSHTPGFVMVGVTESADIGVDVEAIDRRMDAAEIAPAVLTPRERDAWDGQRETFLQRWTLKESYIKARGLGLSLDLQTFGFTSAAPWRLVCEATGEESDDWQFTAFAPATGHVAAAAVRCSGVRWLVHTVKAIL